MDDDDLIDVLGRASDAIAIALDGTDDWGEAGTRSGQHHSDLAADAAATSVLADAGLTVFSEESGWSRSARDLVVVVDPLDGSTNAHRGISWWATSLCAIDADGPRAAVVDDLVHGTRTTAVRGGGARRDGMPLTVSGCEAMEQAIVGLNGLPAHYLGWAQCRALGAAALDVVAVAAGHLDAYLDCSPSGLAPWDYLGAQLVCTEAGGVVRALDDRPLHDLSAPVRRTILAAATSDLADELGRRWARSGPLPRLDP